LRIFCACIHLFCSYLFSFVFILIIQCVLSLIDNYILRFPLIFFKFKQEFIYFYAFL